MSATFEGMLDMAREAGRNARLKSSSSTGAACDRLQTIYRYAITPVAQGGPEEAPNLDQLVAAWWEGFHAAAEELIEQDKERRRIARAAHWVAKDSQAQAEELRQRYQQVEQRQQLQQEAQALGLKGSDCGNTAGLLYQGGTASGGCWRVERHSSEMPHLIRFLHRGPSGAKRLDQVGLWQQEGGWWAERWMPRPPVVPAAVLEAVEAQLRAQAAPAPAPEPPPAPARVSQVREGRRVREQLSLF